MIVALVALVIALGGTAVAASHYLITSTSQIKPSVLRELRSDPASMAVVPKGPKAIVNRVRLTSPTQTTTANPGEGTPLPISSGTWTQAANQANALIGQVTVASPPEGSCSEVGDDANIEVRLDGSEVAYARALPFSPYKPQQTRPLTWSLPFAYDTEGGATWLPDGSSPSSHSLQVYATDSCGDGTHFTIEAVSIDVLGFR